MRTARNARFIGGTDVTDCIRTPEISMAASVVSTVPQVRRAMVARQQELAQRQSMLLDGRDIGTRVLPNATLKIYLTASAEVRARRRFEELKAKGDPSTYEQVLADVRSRDERDTTRETDPLRPAEDAQVLDSSDMTRRAGGGRRAEARGDPAGACPALPRNTSPPCTERRGGWRLFC